MAVTLTLNQLAVQLRYTTLDSIPPAHEHHVDLTSWLAAATEWVERRAPLAPTSTQNTAVALIAGYWAQAAPASPQRFGYNAWQNSGAAQILAPYIDRRAEAI